MATTLQFIALEYKDWRCLSVKPAELQRSYPHLDISPGGWVGKEQTRWARAQGAGVRVVPRVCHRASQPEGQVMWRLSVCPASWDRRCGWFPHNRLSQSEGGARASKGAYTFHRSQMGFCELYGMQLGPLRLAVEAGLNLAFVGDCQFPASITGNPSRNAVVPVFCPRINGCSYSRLFSIPLLGGICSWPIQLRQGSKYLQTAVRRPAETFIPVENHNPTDFQSRR